jgi:hypothetical protein
MIKDILHYNNQLVLFIVLILLIIFIVVLGYKLWERYVGLYLDISMGFKNKENFNQISLEKQVSLYDDYRNYINGKNDLTSYCMAKDKRMIPYIVSPKCFSEKYSKCMEKKEVTTPVISKEITQSVNKSDIFSIYDEDDYFANNSNMYENNLLFNVEYEEGFEIASKKCQDESYDMCLTDNFNFY